MIHAFKMNGYNIILDQNSGCVHSVDEATYDIINMYETTPKEEIKKAILEKYKDIHFENNMALPVISNQKMNDYLKEIAAICGIEKTLTYHVARHSCATSVLLANGVPIETVSKILGHTNIRTTQIYARITDLKVSSDMEILAQKLDVPHRTASR